MQHLFYLKHLYAKRAKGNKFYVIYLLYHNENQNIKYSETRLKRPLKNTQNKGFKAMW